MSDTDPKPPNKTGASGAAWSEAEKIAYLIVLCENEGRIDAKISNAPIPAGRSIVSCKKLLVRLKEKHKDDIAKIKNGESFASTSTIGAGAGAGAGGDLLETPKSTPRKRKSKDSADVGVGGGGAADGEEGVEGSPKKKGKAASRPRKKKDVVKEEVKEEERDGLDDFEAELV